MIPNEDLPEILRTPNPGAKDEEGQEYKKGGVSGPIQTHYRMIGKKSIASTSVDNGVVIISSLCVLSQPGS
jgi:hypothetical protein